MKRFPVVCASGSHYDVGHAIGTALKVQIEHTLSKNRGSVGAGYDRLLKQISPYLEPTRKYFPWALDEIRGIADGSGMPLEELFLGNTMELFNADRIASANHCTITAIPSGNSYILGHNEDAQGYTDENLYLLDATVEDTHIFGLSYIDGIIGSSVAVNGYGLVQAINSLPCKDESSGVPRNIIARAVLDCKTLAEVEALLKNIPRASGYNHVLIQGDELWNIESTSNDYRIVKIIGERFVHTNHYLTDIGGNTSVNELDLKNSRDRYGKAAGLLSSAKTPDDVMAIQSQSGINNGETIGSCVIDMDRKKVYIARGRPSPEAYYSIDIKETHDQETHRI